MSDYYGPWDFERSRKQWLEVHEVTDSRGKQIYRATYADYEQVPRPHISRLIAAAPALVEALEKISEGVEAGDYCDWCGCPTNEGHYEDCGAFIARAALGLLDAEPTVEDMPDIVPLDDELADVEAGDD